MRPQLGRYQMNIGKLHCVAPGALPPVDAGERNGGQYLGVGAISRTRSPLVSDRSQLEKQDGH